MNQILLNDTKPKIKTIVMLHGKFQIVSSEL